MENTAISWTDHTFNPWIGCVHAGPECDFCYAEVQADRYTRTRGLWGKDAARLPTGDAYWKQPDAWNRKAAKNGRRERVFCGSMCDALERGAKLDELRARLWPIVERTTWLDWLLLTKRPDGYRDLVPPHWHRYEWPPNVWAGTTCGTRAGLARVNTLCGEAAGARVRFVSCEPMLEAIGFAAHAGSAMQRGLVNWIIFGGESGHHARPTNVEWIRLGIRQCREYGAAPFVKQLGAKWYDSWTRCGVRGSVIAPAGEPFEWVAPDGAFANPTTWPEDLKVQEFPR